MNYDKPFRTYTEQLDKLKNEYVLDISNKNFSLEALQTVSYYELVAVNDILYPTITCLSVPAKSDTEKLSPHIFTLCISM